MAESRESAWRAVGEAEAAAVDAECEVERWMQIHNTQSGGGPMGWWARLRHGSPEAVEAGLDAALTALEAANVALDAAEAAFAVVATRDVEDDEGARRVRLQGVEWGLKLITHLLREEKPLATSDLALLDRALGRVQASCEGLDEVGDLRGAMQRIGLGNRRGTASAYRQRSVFESAQTEIHAAEQRASARRAVPLLAAQASLSLLRRELAGTGDRGPGRRP